MKPIHSTVLALQAKMFANRLKIGDVCNRAGVATSTWVRWKGGARPNVETIDSVAAAIDAMISEQPQPPETPHGD